MRRVVSIVDDEPSVLRALKRICEANGFDVRLYSSGEEFLNAAPDASNCVVLDIHLGGLSGVEVKRCLAARHLDTPVIFMTGMDSPAIREEVNRVGCDDFLRKPFTGNVLIDAVRRATSRHTVEGRPA